MGVLYRRLSRCREGEDWRIKLQYFQSHCERCSDQGFLQAEGIEAEIIRLNPNVATMALVDGDVGYSTLIGSLIGAALKGAKLKMIACSQDRTRAS